MKTVLTIAGSDCISGAGIQADIKTIAAHGLYATSVITALTAQNTTGVYGVEEVSPDFVAKQLDCVFMDIPPDSVKIGMVSGEKTIQAIAAKLRQYGAKHVVMDPVMVSTSGTRLLSEAGREALLKELLPLVALVTPNLPEAQVLSGLPVETEGDMLRAAREISRLCRGAVLIKGGHLSGDAADLLYQEGKAVWLRTRRISNPNTHGTGCTLSSAIACGLAAGYQLEESVRRAKAYLTGALSAGLDLGRGSGPLDHTYRMRLDGKSIDTLFEHVTDKTK